MGNKIEKKFISILILLQPFFDILTFWAFKINLSSLVLIIRAVTIIALFMFVYLRNPKNIRLVSLSLLFPIFVLIRSIIFKLALNVFSFTDMEKALKVFFMPFFLLMLLWYTESEIETNEYTLKSAWKALAAVPAISFIVLITGLATNTDLKTYSKDWISIGLNGWFYSSNSQSIILYTTIPFLISWMIIKDKPWAFLVSSAMSWVLLYFNGTRVAYIGIFTTFGSILLIMLIQQLINNKIKYKLLFYTVSILILIFAVFLYPMSVTYQMSSYKLQAIVKDDESMNKESLSVSTNSDKDLFESTPPKKSNVIDDDPSGEDIERISSLVKSYIDTDNLSEKMINDLYLVLKKTSSQQRVDKRFIQRTFVNISMKNANALNYLLGFESSWFGHYVDDIESDYAAIFGYYGLFGILLYFFPISYLIYMIIRNMLGCKIRILISMEIIIPAIVTLSLFGIAYMAGRSLQQASTSLYSALTLVLTFQSIKKNCTEGKRDVLTLSE